MTIEQIIQWIDGYTEIYITGHIHPDGDCVGAAIGLRELLLAHGIKAKILLENPPEVYSFLNGYEEIIQQNPEQVEVLFVVDCNDQGRFTPFLDSYNRARVVINIDHHELAKGYISDKHWVEPEKSSTSEMIYDLFGEETVISKAAADALYTGIIFDTGGFMHSNTQESTMIAAGRLMRAGADFNFIMKRLFHRQTVNKLMAKKIALQNLCFLGGDKIAATMISYQEMQENHLSKEDTEDVVHMLAQLEEIEAAVFAAEFSKGNYKLSFRSKRHLDVCEVAGAFGGGGHKKAAGASSDLPAGELFRQIEKEIISRL